MFDSFVNNLLLVGVRELVFERIEKYVYMFSVVALICIYKIVNMWRFVLVGNMFIMIYTLIRAYCFIKGKCLELPQGCPI